MNQHQVMKLCKVVIISVLMIVAGASFCWAGFSYTIKDPTSADAQKYIVSKSNVSLVHEGSFIYWRPNMGASTEDATPPGILVFHFHFSSPITDGTLYARIDTFHWAYSQGHACICVSVDGQNWELLSEATPPEYGKWQSGAYSGSLPSMFIGRTDVYIRMKLYSYGPKAAQGGVWDNTAQALRYNKDEGNTTFKLVANADGDSGSEASYYTTGNASFDAGSGILHVPCVKIGDKYYWVDFRVSSYDPLQFVLANGGSTNGGSQCSVFDSATMTLNLTRLFLNGGIYNLVIRYQNGLFSVASAAQTGSYGSSGRCYIGCRDPYPERRDCAVACDGFWLAFTALSDSGYWHRHFGPASWASCAAEMRSMGISGW